MRVAFDTDGYGTWHDVDEEMMLLTLENEFLTFMKKGEVVRLYDQDSLENLETVHAELLGFAAWNVADNCLYVHFNGKMILKQLP